MGLNEKLNYAAVLKAVDSLKQPICVTENESIAAALTDQLGLNVIINSWVPEGFVYVISGDEVEWVFGD